MAPEALDPSGFSIIEAALDALTMRFINLEGAEIYSYTLRK